MNETLPAAPETHAGSILQQIERMLRSDIDPAKVEAMMDLYNRERDRYQFALFNKAMTELQSECFEVSASGRNPTFNKPYPDLGDLVRESRPYLSKYGFSIRFGTVLQKTKAPPVKDGWLRVVLIISHTTPEGNEGHWEEHYLDGPPDIGGRRTSVQGIGSTVAYLRRYLLQMMLNLVPKGTIDDDGSGGGDVPLTPEQTAEIQRLAQQAGTSDEELKKWLKRRYQVETVGELKARDYVDIANIMHQRNQRKENA